MNTLCPVLVQRAILRVLELAKQGEAGAWGSDQCPAPDGVVTLVLSLSDVCWWFCFAVGQVSSRSLSRLSSASR